MHYLLFIICIGFSYAQVTPETYLGQWQIEGGSVIEIYKKSNLYYGKIIKRAAKPLSNLNGLDNKNPDKGLRGRKLVGCDIISNLSFKEKELEGGTIYNADSGKTYDVKLWIEEENKNLCYIRAYKAFLFKTFEAKRFDPSD
ncbi:DUF2147 domain-containing protein [Aquimarina sp. ERC-38]|uniref:DUF2147 domain-containing protein n=1 Tax=Aquimarina sp. ERC-38 TaxID=2949996 RepID=UPI002245B061|nr:DUF2147 domain-containing protein [Aquimarina sp. ERC-38]UZO79824.1 DUF2147 domain-containing protein [Aquimarina sp. ERC-38]